MDEEEVWVEYRSFNPEKQLVEVDLSSYPIPRASSKKYGGWTSLCHGGGGVVEGILGQIGDLFRDYLNLGRSVCSSS